MRENRRLKIYLVALLALTAMLGLREARAFTAPAAVEAQRFVLRDAQGRERAVLTVDPDGAARLSFYREDGSKAMSLSEKPEMVPVR
ncbi:MAG: hypothetical protein DMF80_12050 [Acidobacteria bacterium]|nr:MAG: hypothetical protein DMF80_12050 [Acidobacteriota bacterium]